MSEPQTLAPEVPNAEELARHFDALGHSVALINAVIAGEQLAEDRVTDEERKAFHDLYGKHWYIFQGVEFIPHEPTWIEQYRVKDPEYNGSGVKAGRPKKNS